MPAILAGPSQVRAGRVVADAHRAPAGWRPRLLSLVAAAAVWFIVGDCLVAAVGYVAGKVSTSWPGTAAYAAGHILGGALLVVAWRSPSLRRQLRSIRTRLTPYLARIRSVLLFVGALTVLRLAWVLLVPTQPASDHAVYHGLAVRLVETGVYDTEKHRAYWPPGYPAFLAALYGVFGVSILAAKLGNVFLAGLADLLTWQAVRRHVGVTAAVVALLLTAAWPGRNLHVDVLSYDELVLVLLLGSMALLPRLSSTPQARSVISIGRRARPDAARWIAAGAVLGLACLVRPTLGVAPLAMGGALLAARCSWRRTALGTALYVAAMLVAIVPWTIRNYVALGGFIPLTTNAGGNFYNSWAPGGTGSFYKPAWEHLQAVTGGDELKLSSTGFALGLAAIRTDPAGAAWRVAQKQVHYLGSDNWLLPVETYTAALGDDATWGAILKTALHTVTNGWYLILMLWPLVGVRGLARRFDEQPLAWLCLGLFVLGLIIHTIFEAQARYHLVYLPLWGIMLAALPARTGSRSRSILSR